MAGTNSSLSRGMEGADPEAPSVILVEPQLGENIGMAARAMLNCGLTDLRLVSPRDGWPSEAANKAASGATAVIEAARVFETTADAVADLQHVFAATARDRHMTKRVLTPRAAADEIRAATTLHGTRTGVLFGKESKGLNNDDVALAQAIVLAPLNPAFSSLNLAQAVLLIGYEWRMACLEAAGETPAEFLTTPRVTRPATNREMVMLYEHLERELTESGFLFPPERAPVMARNLRNMLGRAQMTEQEVRTFRGVIASLRHGKRGTPPED